MPTDYIRLHNMRFYAYHGVFPEEKKLGQCFEIDIEIGCDLSTAGQNDDLENSVDYSQVYSVVRACVEDKQFGLLEALAEHIAETIHENWKPNNLTLRVRKPSPPIPGNLDSVEIEITRSYE
ncbi:MAG: dihydroneopterin aldolase [Candidatus Latescibacterota bacterium]|nr:dihydroneopterin aldolase [Candidatus Latescibacterota bacterium]